MLTSTLTLYLLTLGQLLKFSVDIEISGDFISITNQYSWGVSILEEVSRMILISNTTLSLETQMQCQCP